MPQNLNIITNLNKWSSVKKSKTNLFDFYHDLVSLWYRQRLLQETLLRLLLFTIIKFVIRFIIRFLLFTICDSSDQISLKLKSKNHSGILPLWVSSPGLGRISARLALTLEETFWKEKYWSIETFWIVLTLEETFWKYGSFWFWV